MWSLQDYPGELTALSIQNLSINFGSFCCDPSDAILFKCFGARYCGILKVFPGPHGCVNKGTTHLYTFAHSFLMHLQTAPVKNDLAHKLIGIICYGTPQFAQHNSRVNQSS